MLLTSEHSLLTTITTKEGADTGSHGLVGNVPWSLICQDVITCVLVSLTGYIFFSLRITNVCASQVCQILSLSIKSQTIATLSQLVTYLLCLCFFPSPSQQTAQYYHIVQCTYTGGLCNYLLDGGIDGWTCMLTLCFYVVLWNLRLLCLRPLRSSKFLTENTFKNVPLPKNISANNSTMFPYILSCSFLQILVKREYPRSRERVNMLKFCHCPQSRSSLIPALKGQETWEVGLRKEKWSEMD